MVIYPYHTIIGKYILFTFYYKTCSILSYIYIIGGGGEYYFIVVSSQGLRILKMAMG